jgi:hypothetical protein
VLKRKKGLLRSKCCGSLKPHGYPFRLKFDPRLFILHDAAETEEEIQPTASESPTDIIRQDLIVCKFQKPQKYPLLLYP